MAIPEFAPAAAYQSGVYAANRLSPILGADGQPLRVARPNEWALPHVLTFTSIFNAFAQTYRYSWDEAVRHNRQNALSMRRSAFLMALLQERKLATAQLNWHLEPEDPDDPAQEEVADELTQIVRRTPHLQKVLMSLLEAIWYGRYAVQWTYAPIRVRGQERMAVSDWRPVHGDKIQYRYYYPGRDEQLDDGTPVILVHASITADLPLAETVITDRGRGLLLRDPYWRQRFCLHAHEVDDADYHDAEMAGQVHGVGIRSRIYWFEWLKQELLEWITTYMQRTGLGLTLFYYDQSNPQARLQAEKAAKEYAKDTVIVWPRPLGAENQGPGVERIETTTAGSEFLFRMLTEYFERHEERLIVGQGISSGTTHKTLFGASSGESEMQATTKYNITRFDAQNLAETLTGTEKEPGLLWTLKRWNFPEADFQVRWVFDIDTPHVKERLEAAKAVFDMGIPLDGNQVRGIAGLSKPEEGAEEVSAGAMMEQEAKLAAANKPAQPAGASKKE